MKFIHFGCWNNGLCGDNTNGLSLTMRKLNSYLETNPVDWIVIAGDNYYPTKDSGGKRFNLIEFESGFNCLPKTLTKYLIFGNHDIDDVIIKDDGTEIKCKLLLSQQSLAEHDSTIKIFNDVMYKKVDNTLIIMLDTNLYTWTDLTTKVSDTCYAKLFNNLVNKSDLSIGNLIKYQNCRIKEIIQLNKSLNNIIFIGHHPIYSIKNKSGKKIVNKLTNFINFFKGIEHVLQEKTIYYLCADTHLYQSGTITISDKLNIIQYIVGTGGAEQDTPYLLDDTVIDAGSIVYSKTSDIKKYGFLVVHIDRDINFEFVQADNPMVGGNYNKKYTIKKLFV